MREGLQYRRLVFQNSAWGHLPYANSIDSIGLEEYELPEEDWELDADGFVPFPNYEFRDLEWVPPCVVEHTVSYSNIYNFSRGKFMYELLMFVL